MRGPATVVAGAPIPRPNADLEPRVAGDCGALGVYVGVVPHADEATNQSARTVSISLGADNIAARNTGPSNFVVGCRLSPAKRKYRASSWTWGWGQKQMDHAIRSPSIRRRSGAKGQVRVPLCIGRF